MRQWNSREFGDRTRNPASREQVGVRWQGEWWCDLVKPVGVMLLCMGTVSLLAGIVGYFVARAGGVILMEPLSVAVPRDKHVEFLADLWAHDAAYASGFLGGMSLCFWVLRRRRGSKSTNPEHGSV